MQPVTIDTLEIDASGILRVRPRINASQDYEHIYRDASAVRWLREDRALTTVGLSGIPPARCFLQIFSAVRNEYGHFLKLTPETQWINVSPDDRAAIESAANEVAV